MDRHPLERDLERIRALLRKGPKTTGELHAELRISSPRIGSLLNALYRRGEIHSPRCVPNSRGDPVYLWECRPDTPGTTDAEEAPSP